MPLDISKLEHVKEKGGKTTAACPACRKEGHDRKGDHLVLYPDGRFGCVVYEGQSAESRAHRKLIWEMAGNNTGAPRRGSRNLVLGFSPVLNPNIDKNQHKTVVLGRFGRSSMTYARTQAGAQAHVCKSLEQPSEPSDAGVDIVAAALRIFGGRIIPDDEIDADIHDRLASIENVLAQRDSRGLISYTRTQVESCAIGLRRHAGTHAKIDTMLLRLDEAKKSALTRHDIAGRQ